MFQGNFDWQVVCEDASESSTDLRAAMLAAIGLPEDARRPEPVRDVALRVWVKQHAEQIERKSTE